MIIIKSSSLTKELLNTGQCGVPLMICTDTPRVYKKILDAGYHHVKINAELSKRLLEYQINDRPKRVEELLRDILNNVIPIYITDFEMLFDPRYEIDVIKLFCEKARIVNIAVRWPGHFINGNLTYAEPGDPDYHEYDCNAYQIRIVQ